MTNGEREKGRKGEREKARRTWVSLSPLLPFSLSRLLLAPCLLLLFTGCLGNYQFGARTLFPEGIETVYVPVFDSASYRRGLGEELTEAVVKEIEKRTPYKVVSSPGAADTVLIGKIVSDNKAVIFETTTGNPRDSQLRLAVKVNWIDERGRPVRNIPNVPIPATAVDISATSDMVPEVGHSVATSQQDIIKQLAEHIVSLMEKPW